MTLEIDDPLNDFGKIFFRSYLIINSFNLHSLCYAALLLSISCALLLMLIERLNLFPTVSTSTSIFSTVTVAQTAG